MVKTMKNVVCFVFFITIVSASFYEEEDYDVCKTPEKELGECIIISKCPLLLSLLDVRPLPSRNNDYLRKAGCGFVGLEPKVCCKVNTKGESTTKAVTQPSLPDTETFASDLLPDLETCGIGAQSRIVGGEVAGLDEFPWMILVEYKKPNGHGFHCGGVLISERYALTAAHCVKGVDLPKNWELVSIRLGEYDTDTDTDCVQESGFKYCSDPPIDVQVAEKIPHELYNPVDINQHHDIAILRLARSVKFSSFIKPICLPTSAALRNDKHVGVNATIAGWGKTENRTESNILLKLGVSIKSNLDCSQVYSPARVNLGEGQICAGGVSGKDSCRGDSGGPLMFPYTQPGQFNWFLTGIVSFGPSPCGLQGWPGIYTRISEYMPWIIKNLKP